MHDEKIQMAPLGTVHMGQESSCDQAPLYSESSTNV